MGTDGRADGGDRLGRPRCSFAGSTRTQRWEHANVVRGRANGTVSARTRTAASATSPPTSSAASPTSSASFGVEVRITNRQNFVLRGLTEDQLADAVRPARRRSAWPRPAPSSRATSCPAPAPTPATSRSRSRAASPPTSATRSRRPASPRSAACASTSPAAPTRAASTTSPTSASSGSSGAPTASAAPGYQMLLGGHVGDMEIEFGEKATQAAGQDVRREAVVRVVGRFAGEREAGETFRDVARPLRRRRRGRARRSKDLDEFPTPDEAPDFYIDFDETGPYVAEIGDSGVRDMTRHARDDRRPDGSRTVAGSRRAGRGVAASSSSEPASVGDRVGVGDASATALVLAASFQDCVLIDIATQVVPEHRGRVPRHAVPLRGDALVRRAGARALRPQPARDHARRSRPTTSGRPTPTSAARCARSSRWPARSRARRRG